MNTALVCFGLLVAVHCAGAVAAPPPPATCVPTGNECLICTDCPLCCSGTCGLDGICVASAAPATRALLARRRAPALLRRSLRDLVKEKTSDKDGVSKRDLRLKVKSKQVEIDAKSKDATVKDSLKFDIKTSGDGLRTDFHYKPVQN